MVGSFRESTLLWLRWIHYRQLMVAGLAAVAEQRRREQRPQPAGVLQGRDAAHLAEAAAAAIAEVLDSIGDTCPEYSAED